MKPDEEPPKSVELLSYMRMRKTIGWLGMLLPFVLLFGNYFLNHGGFFNNDWFVQINEDYSYQNQGSFKNSVSHYYYTTMGEIFTGTLFAVGLFMVCYKGHPKRDEDKGFSDNVMTNLAGLFAMGVAIFPTTARFPLQDNLRSFISTGSVGNIHYIFAGLFFFTLAVMSMVNFRRSKEPGRFGKGPDDPFFLTCGIIMLACLALVPTLGRLESIERFHTTFILEAIALIAFGLSWLKKGQAEIFNYTPRKMGLHTDATPKD